MTRKTELVVPSARRLIMSLRDFGYEFATAVADVVDNSIAAQATEIDIEAKFRGGASFLKIQDNGEGMEKEVLVEAMRFGTEREYDMDQDLGKFGLGLKTASLSQCRRLYAVSRAKGKSKKEISGFYWDLDDVIASNKWEISQVSPSELQVLCSGNLNSHSGTIVVWQKLDRITEYQNPDGDIAHQTFLSMLRDLELYLGMVFHRFLLGEVPGRKILISLNGSRVIPWDPFVKNEKMTKKMDEHEFVINVEGKSARVKVQPFILPIQRDFSSAKAHEDAGGRNKWNRQQGLYIYRGNRIIQAGGWSRLRAVDEHTKLARVAVQFWPDADAAFKINVSKMQVQLPKDLRNGLGEFLKPVIKQADEIYRRHGKGTLPVPGQRTKKKVRNLTFEDAISLYLDRIEVEALKVADPSEKPVIKRVFSRMRKKGG